MSDALGIRGEFRLLHKIGEGGMADVFLAERLGDDGFKTRVALKRLHRGLAMDSYFIRQLVREARLLGQLEHANIVKVFDLRRIGDEYYVVMEYVDGIDLAAVIKVHRTRKTRIPRPFFFHVALSLTEALAYAHNAIDPDGNATPLIHRDIKPSNVMLSRRGIVKLTDFGIAHVGDGSVTGGLVQGTANYMSPEQAFGEERLTAASDVYSLGSVFYEMLSGRSLIDGENYLKAIHQARERTVSLEELAELGVEPGLRMVIAKMLNPDVGLRYAEMDSVRNDLQFVADRLRIDLSWHRIRAYVGRLMGILGRAPDRATLSNVGIPALTPPLPSDIGPQAMAPDEVDPLPSSDPRTPPTPVPRRRLDRSAPVTQAVQKDLLDSYIAMAQIEAPGAESREEFSSSALQPLTPTTPPPRRPLPPPVTPGAPTWSPSPGPSSPRPSAARLGLDASTVAGPAPGPSSEFAPAASPGAPSGRPPLFDPPGSRPPLFAPVGGAGIAPAGDWGDGDRTRVYGGPTPAQQGVYGTGEMRALAPVDEDKTRPLPMPGAPAPLRPPGRASIDDATHAYGGSPGLAFAPRSPAVSARPPLPAARGADPELPTAPHSPEVEDRETETWEFTDDVAATPPPPRRKKRRRRRKPVRRGPSPRVIGLLIGLIVVLLAVLVLLLVSKYRPRAEGPGSTAVDPLALYGGNLPRSPVSSDRLPAFPERALAEVRRC